MDSTAINRSKASEDVVLELNYEIEEDVEAELEDFVRLSHTGQFKDAHELYDECLSSHDDWYPVAAEYADCLLREGEFEQLKLFSRKAFIRFKDPSEINLFLLMKAVGNRAPLLQGLSSVRQLKPPYTSLKDIDVHILEIRLQILVASGANPVDFDARLASDHISPGMWVAFKDWFYHLLEQKCFWKAQRILHSLFHKISRPECEDLVNYFIKEAVSTNAGQESVQIAVSSLVQRFVYVVESKPSSPWAVVQWNDAIHWALFGEYLNPNILLPLNGVRGNDEMSDLLLEAVTKGDLSVFRQALDAERIHYTLDEINSAALLKSAQFCMEGKMPPFLNSNTVNTQDGYQRAPIHWACLKGQLQAVKLLLWNGKADTGLLDWFGCTPLQYAAQKNPEIMDWVLNDDFATETRTQKTWSPLSSNNDEGLSGKNHKQFSLHGGSPDGLGLSVLYPPTGTGDDDAIVDIVFVHGLGGSRYGTWKKNGSLWPQTMLAQDFPKARIMTWGYDADVIHFFGPVGHGNVQDHAKGLSRDLSQKRFKDYQVFRPIIFVAHSLGGLIVKDALFLSYRVRGVDHPLAAIESSTKGVLFAGTPHRVVNKKMWAATATNLAWYIQKDHSDEVLNTLKRGSEVLERLQDSFKYILEHFAIYTLIEDIGYPKIGRIVDKYSAIKRMA